MPPSPADEPSPGSVAVEVARLTGRIDQVIVDHERRISALELRITGSGTRAAAIAAPWIAGGGLLLVLAGKVPWL